jgi:HEPN domain
MANERALFQQLAEARLKEAKLLLREHEPSGAYYLAGYSIECALKAIIAKQFRANAIPDKNLVKDVYSHELPKLLRLAGLESELNTACRTDSELDRRWSIIKNWDEQARYRAWSENKLQL